MGVKHRVVFDKTERMAQSVVELNGTRITVGPKGEHAWLAGIHEYGCKIPVTDKMRAFFRGHFKINLKKSTTVITIPERSFLRAGHDQHIGEVLDMAGLLVSEVVGGTITTADMANTVGGMLRDKIKLYARDLSSPANAGLTVRSKGSSNPLVDTGGMISGIEYDVE
ncbi:hypothetical protein LJC49_04505 [Ruminococcaceae bacterium OttesenSCG-928-I18]|nr:hypothetical protein [Ruminococcaceae bacterium OttesenSCG-928-I18]